MAQISVVGTVHEEKGAATVAALHAILMHLDPEVIFLEIPVETFPDFENGARRNLEWDAVKRYREDHDVVLVPVDSTTPDESFFRDLRYLDRRLTTTSPKYRHLVDQNSANTVAGGFPYLNSAQCDEAWADINDAMLVAAEQLWNDPRLGEILAAWRRTNSMRDSSIVQRLADHARLRPFNTGVLLIGAAHRQSIMKNAPQDGAVQLLTIEFSATLPGVDDRLALASAVVPRQGSQDSTRNSSR